MAIKTEKQTDEWTKTYKCEVRKMRIGVNQSLKIQHLQQKENISRFFFASVCAYLASSSHSMLLNDH